MGLTLEQRCKIAFREVKVGKILSPPMKIYTIYEDEYGLKPIITIDNRKADRGYAAFKIMEILDTGFVRCQQYPLPVQQELQKISVYLEMRDLEYRPCIEWIFRIIFLGAFYQIKNLFVKKKG